nr:hypothetical protein [uncultured Prevotella sp.]
MLSFGDNSPNKVDIFRNRHFRNRRFENSLIAADEPENHATFYEVNM